MLTCENKPTFLSDRWQRGRHADPAADDLLIRKSANLSNCGFCKDLQSFLLSLLLFLRVGAPLLTNCRLSRYSEGGGGVKFKEQRRSGKQPRPVTLKATSVSRRQGSLSLTDVTANHGGINENNLKSNLCLGQGGRFQWYEDPSSHVAEMWLMFGLCDPLNLIYCI